MFEGDLEKIANAPDELFPDFLFSPLFNDFDDHYYERAMSMNPKIQAVMNLRRKYSNYFDYLDALNIYEAYIDEMIEKYGSKGLYISSVELGLCEDIIPIKPKLKNKRVNREFLRSGIIPSRKMYDPEVDFVALAREIFPGANGDNVDERDSEAPPDKKTAKILKRVSEQIAGRNRRKNLYSSLGHNHGSELIVEFLNAASSGYYDKGVTSFRNGRKETVSELIREERKEELIPVELRGLDTAPKSIIQNGILVNAQESAQIELLKELYNIGIDLTGNSRSMSKKAIKMVRRELGIYETGPMTPKQLRKYKKRMKREQEKLDKRRDYDQMLNETLLKNKISASRNGSSLSLRLRDIYSDSDI